MREKKLLLKSVVLGVGVAALSSVAYSKEVVEPNSEAVTLGSLGVGGPDFLRDTEVFVKGRLRAEYADQDAKADDSGVLSVRHRFGLITPEVAGFSLLAEGEHTWILSDTDAYNPYPAGTDSVIADPDNFDLNRLHLTYTHKESSAVLGRQYINHADQRFIGAVGWRQNDQTFDAFTLSSKAFNNLSLTYSYVDQVNRIFGTDAPVGGLERWHGDVHMFRAEYSGCDYGSLSCFAYLMDFDNAVTSSSNTYGAELKGKSEGLGLLPAMNYLVTAALQTDAGDNTDYEEYYFRAELSTGIEQYQMGMGAERMTSDGMKSFIFPLGTNHKFNGFADAFLNTPAEGLRDYHAWVAGTCGCGISHKLIWHHFSSDEGNDYLGYEIDYVAKKKLTENASALLKLAHLEGHGVTKDVQRASIQLDYSF